MKRFILFLVFACLFSLNVKAGIYHGIDIDNVFEKSDWSNKEKIKEVIDDYALLLQWNSQVKFNVFFFQAEDGIRDANV